MNKKYFLNSPIKMARFSRMLAKLIDIFIILILSMFTYPFGLMIAIAYMALSDSLQHGQSIGKKIIGFNVISLLDGKPCSFKQSTIRNLPLIIPMALAVIPIWGWALGLFFGIIFSGLEIYLLFTLDSGHRLGDVMADTTVIANDPDQVSLRKKKENGFETGHLLL